MRETSRSRICGREIKLNVTNLERILEVLGVGEGKVERALKPLIIEESGGGGKGGVKGFNVYIVYSLEVVESIHQYKTWK